MEVRLEALEVLRKLWSGASDEWFEMLTADLEAPQVLTLARVAARQLGLGQDELNFKLEE